MTASRTDGDSLDRSAAPTGGLLPDWLVSLCEGVGG